MVRLHEADEGHEVLDLTQLQSLRLSPPKRFLMISERLRLHPRFGLVFWEIRAEGAAHILVRRGSYFHFFDILVLLGSRSTLILFVNVEKKRSEPHEKQFSSLSKLERG